MIILVEGIVMCFALLIVCVVGIANGPVGLVLLYEKYKEVFMAKNVSSVKPQSGNLRSHSNRAVKHSRKPNLQNITIA